MLREVFRADGVELPPGGSDAEVWAWLYRADMAFAAVGTLLEVRQSVSIMLELVDLVVRFVEPEERRLFDALPAIVWGRGPETEEVIQLNVEAQKIHQAFLERKDRDGWQWQAMHAYFHAARAVGALLMGHEKLSRGECTEAVGATFDALRTKDEQLEGLPEGVAASRANQAMLGLLRARCSPRDFLAPVVSAVHRGSDAVN